MGENISCDTCSQNNICPVKGYSIHYLKIIKDDGNPKYIQIHIPACNEYRQKEVENERNKI